MLIPEIDRPKANPLPFCEEHPLQWPFVGVGAESLPWQGPHHIHARTLLDLSLELTGTLHCCEDGDNKLWSSRC